MIRAAVVGCVIVAFAQWPASDARSQSIEAAQAAYADGRFTEAAELAARLGTSEGHALAAKSLSIHAHHVAEGDDRQNLFDNAAALAREAIGLDPRNADAHLELAHAMGRFAQTLGAMQAMRGGYARRVRDAIQDALALDPDMMAAHLSLAAWHAEASTRGGFMASALYGASRARALEHYERALELAPDEKIVLVEYAYGLLLLDDENRERARDLLARAVRIPSEDAHDRILHSLATARLAALDTDG